MNFSGPQSKESSRGGWRIVSGLLLVGGLTLALGFYLPLRQSHGLLTERLAAAQNTAAQLNESLENAQTALKRVTTERAELEEFKHEVQAHKQRFSDLLERSSALKAASAKGTIQAQVLADGLSVDWTDKGLLTANGSALSRSGQKLLCVTATEANRSGLTAVTVRTFSPSDADEPYAEATTLAISLAERLAKACSIPVNSVSVASSPASPDSPLLRFEFRQSAPKKQVKL